MNNLKIPKDVVIFPENENKWRIFNVFTKTCLGVNTDTLSTYKKLEFLKIDEITKLEKEKKWKVWDIEIFSNEKGLMEDPSRFIRKTKMWPKSKNLSLTDLKEKLISKYLLIENDKKYRNVLEHKRSVLDKKHLGNFHEQLGQHLMLNLRESPDTWWKKQKFNDNFSNTKNNLYRAIQTNFLKKYIPTKFTKNSNVLDLGCGVGFYSKMIGKTGATVKGLDPNEKSINIAKEKCPKNVTFKVANIGFKGGLDFIKDNSLDFVFMSDALLFYFFPIEKSNKPELKILLNDIKRILKPKGVFISMEPHYIFWLLPWLGEIQNPFTIITEYHYKKFSVTPSISQFVKSITSNGFFVKTMDEIYPEQNYKKIDERAFYFSNQFPLWQLLEFVQKT